MVDYILYIVGPVFAVLLLGDIFISDTRFLPSKGYPEVGGLSDEKHKLRNRKALINSTIEVGVFFLFGGLVLLLPTPKDYRIYFSWVSALLFALGVGHFIWYVIMFNVPPVNVKWFNAFFDEKGNFRK